MGNDSDGDIRIFGREQNPSEDNSFIEEMQRQRQNGNSQRARELGRELADTFILADDLTEKDASYAYHVRELRTFAVLSTLERALENRILCATAVNAFYDKLIKYVPDFYERVSGGTAFSFYYIDIKSKKDVPLKIGRSFSMLCGSRDGALTEAGADVFTKTNEQVNIMIEEMDFS